MTYTSRIKPILDELLWPKVENVEALQPLIVKKKNWHTKAKLKEIIGESTTGKRSINLRFGYCKS